MGTRFLDALGHLQVELGWPSLPPHGFASKPGAYNSPNFTKMFTNWSFDTSMCGDQTRAVVQVVQTMAKIPLSMVHTHLCNRSAHMASAPANADGRCGSSARVCGLGATSCCDGSPGPV